MICHCRVVTFVCLSICESLSWFLFVFHKTIQKKVVVVVCFVLQCGIWRLEMSLLFIENVICSVCVSVLVYISLVLVCAFELVWRCVCMRGVTSMNFWEKNQTVALRFSLETTIHCGCTFFHANYSRLWGFVVTRPYNNNYSETKNWIWISMESLYVLFVLYILQFLPILIKCRSSSIRIQTKIN